MKEVAVFASIAGVFAFLIQAASDEAVVDALITGALVWVFTAAVIGVLKWWLRP